MKLDRAIGIKAAVTWLPPTRQTVEEAIAKGELTPKHAAGLGVTELPISEDSSAAEMAVLAGQRALRRAELGAEVLGLLAHGSVYHQGHDFWPASHYVADQLGCPARTFPLGINQGSNSGAAALQMAVNALLADPAAGYALVTTADRFGAPTWDRWMSNPSVAYGDGATAALLHRRDGSADEFVLLALESSTAPEFEAMYRGRRPFSPAPMLEGATDFFERRMEYYNAHGVATFTEVARGHVRAGLVNALAEADVAADDPRIRCVVLPRLGGRSMDIMFGGVLEDVLPKADILRLGARTGHLGGGDVIANLADVRTAADLAPGDIAVITGGGSGFTWTTVLVEVPDPATG